ncbi:Glutathione S-transferase [Oryctes borbonicus]|uniref:Glutathione S-transferase n=1 Tax=Oryctes borbonicus TaxID=1629725 RepID=A0A0T6AZK4_9SCAR|nr:Glutathione S-transferase [Oryctes borbonicus]
MYKILLTSSRNNDENRDTIMEGLETFENELAHRQGPFFGGNVPGMLDYMIWPWCERADLLKLFGSQFALNKDKYKRLVEWKLLMRDDPAVQKTLMDTDCHIKFIQSHRAGIPEYDLLST